MIRARSLLRSRIFAGGLVVALLTAAAFAWMQAAPSARRAAAPQSMAALLPQGALLTIESPDFSALLAAWTSSPQSAAWFKSDNYDVFANSRLFGRLADAQAEFASTAALDSAGTSFLKQVAGHRSIFAWYDVGNLEFLYITRMDPAQAAQTKLLQSRSHFSRRQSGSATFFVRTQIAPDKATQRTVAFAISGDLLLLATREDLMANALQLIQNASVSSPANAPAASLAQEPWYADAVASQPTPASPAPDLHMVLNLERIVPLPYFRTYWIQRNITEIGRFRTAVADLYRESTPQGAQFREERTLLAKSPDPAPADLDLAPLAALAPPSAGVFRARASTDSAAAVATMQEKILGYAAAPTNSRTEASDPTLDAAPEGSVSDLETRIDTPAPALESAASDALTHLLSASGLNATLTVDSAGEPAQEQSNALWIPIHSALVLRTDRPLDPAALRSALQQTLRGTLTAATLGIEFRPTPADPTILALNGPKPLFLALAGNLCLLANDQPLLRDMLARLPASAQAASTPALVIASFNHSSQRAPYARLTYLIDAASQPSASPPRSAAAPPFFSGNVRSLSDTFADLQSEHVLIRHQGEALHQTVVYQWQP